jgi:methylenetetrahydrofolate dehydrogenase (NADP+)/methenyltetrahydrofolate cyclohydrolase
MPDTVMMTAEPLVSSMKETIRSDVECLKSGEGHAPRLVALLIGKDPVSRTYVELKTKDCADVGITSDVIDLSDLSADESSGKVLGAIASLNQNPLVNAVIPQMPFDGRVSEKDLFSMLSPLKDVDGLTPFRLGKLLRKEYVLEDSILPCTPKGIMELLKFYGVKLEGSDAAIIGRSLLVGEPLRKLMQDENATATCYHTNSKNLKQRVREADIVVAASGRPPEIYGESGFKLTREMVKEGAIVIGVGVKKDLGKNKMIFDVDTKSLKGVCSYLTPNIGGVGAMTRAVLLQNTVIAMKEQHSI